MKHETFFLCFFFLISACGRAPEYQAGEPSTAIVENSTTRLAQGFKPELGTHTPHSGFIPLIEGKDALISRIATIRAADKALDIQYYIWHEDPSGKLLLQELLMAADRGVRVRLLLDDLNQSDLNETLHVLDTHPNIEVRMSNPLVNRRMRILDALRVNQIHRRMHNKSVIADNVIGIIGGRNVGDEYFSASDEMNFGDLDVWCLGPIVTELSKQFDLYWNSKISVPIANLDKDQKVGPDDFEKLRSELKSNYETIKTGDFGYSLKASPLSDKFETHKLEWYWADGKAIYDSPKKLDTEKNEKAPSIKKKMDPLIDGARSELIVVSSYYIPREDGVEQMKDLVDRGIKTVVLTNSLASNDVIGAFAGYKDYRESLIKAGVALYELKPQANMEGVRKKIGSSGSKTGLHGKFYIKDRQEILIGSMNLDPRSLEHNTEMGVLISSPPLAEKMATDLLKEIPTISYHLTLDSHDQLKWTAIEQGKPITFDSEPEVNIWLRFAAEAVDLIVPETLL